MITNETSNIDYQFTVDWFRPHIPVWNAILTQYSFSKILEIGSFEGRSTCHLIELLGRTTTIELHCVDTWLGGTEHSQFNMSDVEKRFDFNTSLATLKTDNPVALIKHKSLSYQALVTLLENNKNGYFDLIYIDGSHQAPDVLSDAILSFHLLKVGGMIIFDDYLWIPGEVGNEDPLSAPKMAIDSFLNIFQRKIRVLVGLPNLQIFALKTAS